MTNVNNKDKPDKACLPGLNVITLLLLLLLTESNGNRTEWSTIEGVINYWVSDSKSAEHVVRG